MSDNETMSGQTKNCGVVLLAAGSSTRMGSPKQLLKFRGKTLIRHAAETALASGCRSVIVVLGARAQQIREELSDVPVEIVENARWQEGMGTSIQTGVCVAEDLKLDGAILALADQPLVTPEILSNLVSEHERTGKPIVASAYAGTVGVPVYFARSHFAQLLALQPSQGCKGVILSGGDDALHIDCPQAETDVDTPEDYASIAYS